MQAVFHSSIHSIDAHQWDALWPSDYPFTRHAFLAALEDSKSIDTQPNGRSGWQVEHLTLEQDGQLIAALPLFVKTHSYGEYVFDWSWASAYEQARLPYYPKLINAIPFTPATGPRIAISTALDEEGVQHCREKILGAINTRVAEQQYSGFHCLFPNSQSAELFRNTHLPQRVGYQFHWFNQGFTDFAHFLESFSSRKRKNIKKERLKVVDETLEIKTRHAADIADEEWQSFYALYQRTYLKRSGHGGYLGDDFFLRLGKALPNNVILVSAHHNDQMLAAALYLRDADTLYGRYWGTQLDVDGLHFECCYYRGIEYAISQGIKRFDPGAQGEHKIQRGFTPIQTQSFHQLSHPGFHQAIEDFVLREKQQIDYYIDEARGLLPFKDDITVTDKNILTRQALVKNIP